MKVVVPIFGVLALALVTTGTTIAFGIGAGLLALGALLWIDVTIATFERRGSRR